MNDPLWRVGVGVKENAAVFGVLGFLAGIIFTFAACSPGACSAAAPEISVAVDNHSSTP